MAKVDLELVKLVLQRNELDVRQVSQIIEDINVEMSAMVEDEQKPPPVKKQFVMMVSDPEGKLAGQNMTGWVLQIPEEDSPYVANERLIKSGYAYNASPKGRRIPVQSIGEICEVVTTKFTKENNVWIKTKEPILLVTTDNKLPMDNSGKF
ncbi:hypothetical protein [Ruficoccus sp. ZRK36]|uniref:hypothetical protein n=1 Tax=Ruficoccus sp. ZRK36 TaxID=2866311 RepID=UPI001C731FEA|nr:hypothetical protein [Ruficoccus sp. ZRK36]QYY35122.1 hypothetical protein K0V07_12540 [Ruficoccus sp. ZRK36]